jgi:hypothetical protein
MKMAHHTLDTLCGIFGEPSPKVDRINEFFSNSFGWEGFQVLKWSFEVLLRVYE